MSVHDATVLNLQRFSLDDGPGIRTTVFLKGCPLSCAWCHNPESIRSAPALGFFEKLCDGCADVEGGPLCVKACPKDAILAPAREGQPIQLDRSRCDACRSEPGGRALCEQRCPMHALVQYGRRMNVEQVLAEVVQDRLFYEGSGGGVTVSGGEPLAQSLFTQALFGACRREGIHCCLETSGMGSEAAMRRLADSADLVLFDLKAVEPQLHRQLCGHSNEPILKNLDMLAQSHDVPLCLRCPLVPGLNDSPQDLALLAGLVRRYRRLEPVQIMPYHAMGNEKRIAIGVPAGGEYPVPDRTQIERWISQLADLGLPAFAQYGGI